MRLNMQNKKGCLTGDNPHKLNFNFRSDYAVLKFIESGFCNLSYVRI